MKTRLSSIPSSSFISSIAAVSGRITEIFANVARDIQRSISIFTRRTSKISRRPTYSWGRADYSYWRRAYYCQVEGLELSGLFIRPIVNKIAAWVLGRPPSLKLANARSQRALEEWWDLKHSDILHGFRSALKQGDSFLVINPDLSVVIIPPDVVDPIVDEQDFSVVLGWRIRQVFPHPVTAGLKMVITDEYFEDRRVRTIEHPSGRIEKRIFDNLIGIIPIIHISNQPGDGERFGHPEAEAMVDLFHRYGQVFEAAIEGNILQGRPTPVLSFKSVQDLNAFWRRYGHRENHTLPDGTTQEIDTLSIDMSELMTVSGADFAYKSPGTFAEDTERLLGLLFYLGIEHIELPEFVMGNAIEGSKASAETQMPVFEIFVRMRQRDCLTWILQIAKVVLGYLAVLEPGVTVEEPVLQWAKLTQNGRLTLDSVKWGFDVGLLDDRTSALLLPIDLEKVDDVIKQAKRDAKKRKALALKDMQAQKELEAKFAPEPGAVAGGEGSLKELEMDPSLKESIDSLDI